MSDRSSAGGYDISVQICNDLNTCCLVYFGDLSSGGNYRKYAESKCKQVHFKRQEIPSVTVTSSSSNQFIPRKVYIDTSGGGEYEAEFRDLWVYKKSATALATLYLRGRIEKQNAVLDSSPIF